jgi:hypothetical protein
MVTSQMIVFKIGGDGGSEKPAFKDIAICVKGRRQTESIAEVHVSTSRRCKYKVSAGASGCWDVTSRDRGASAN